MKTECLYENIEKMELDKKVGGYSIQLSSEERANKITSLCNTA